MQPRKRYRVKWFRLAVWLIAGYCLYILVGQQTELNALSREKEATRVRVEQLSQMNKTLSEEKVRLGTSTYVEKIARDELGLVKPGEVPYVPAEKNR